MQDIGGGIWSIEDSGPRRGHAQNSLVMKLQVLKGLRQITYSLRRSVTIVVF